MDTLFKIDLNTEKDELIEVVLSYMRYHKNLFRSEFNKNKKNIKKKLTNKLEELNQAIQFNADGISQIETEIKHIDDENLQEQAIYSSILCHDKLLLNYQGIHQTEI